MTKVPSKGKVCRLCGRRSRRVNQDSLCATCHDKACKRSKSVRAAQGGLPSLGKRR